MTFRVTLFSMQAKVNPCKIYILKIYADQTACQSHIRTDHFRKYKEGTPGMVKSLQLIDVNALLPEAMPGKTINLDFLM